MDFTNIMRDKTDYLSFEEINVMLQWCFEQGRTRDYMLITTLFRTARRVTEIIGKKPFTNYKGFRPVDIHNDGLIEFDILKKDHVRRKTKSGQKRDPETIKKLMWEKGPRRLLFPVDDGYLQLIRQYIKHANIYPYKRIFPVCRQRVDQIIKEIAQKCGIVRPRKKIHAHNFRHSLAIHLLKDNPNDASVLKQLQEILAHSDIKITMHYAQFTQGDKKASLNRLFQGQ